MLRLASPPSAETVQFERPRFDEDATIEFSRGRWALRGRDDLTQEQIDEAVSEASRLLGGPEARGFAPDPKLVRAIREWGFDEPLLGASVVGVIDPKEPQGKDAVMCIQLGDDYGTVNLFFSGRADPAKQGQYAASPNFFVSTYSVDEYHPARAMTAYPVGA